ncbi:MAG TPA: ribonuclease P protein component [Tepidisphaeraceae bacterium]|jgi:ribonuclease P protein component|nr:ribonuclease P protein component [Tepidisphaeraceae bacterium]
MPGTGTFPKSMRLRGKEAFAAVYDARTRMTRGLIVVYAKPNGLVHSRMGLSVSRRVGTAPKRNRIKRLLRESFRLMQRELSRGYDWIVVVKPHTPMKLEEYREMLMAATVKLDETWKKRNDQQ